MPAARNLQFTAHLPSSLATRLNLCARYSGKAADTIVSDLVAACMEALPDVLENGADGVVKLLELLQLANVEGYEKARSFLHNVVGIEAVWNVEEEAAFLARASERLPSQGTENEQRPTVGSPAWFSGTES